MLAVPAVALVAVLAFMAGRLSPVATEPGGSPVAGASASTAPSRSPRPTPTILPTRTPTPVAGPCELPESIPVAAAPVAAPAVEASPLAMTFASHTYSRDAAGSPLPRNDVANDWSMGLWFVAPGAAQARLLVEAVEGMVLPLALSPAGDTVAVWWLPERRPEGALACVSGIYLVSVADGTSRLLVSGDWSVVPDEEDEFAPGGGLLWRDPRGPGHPRTYSLPAAAFSANGQFLALVASLSIELYHLRPGGVDPDRLERQHVGECRDWAWSPAGVSFVAACEHTTSAWIGIDINEGSGPESVAIPYPEEGRGFLSDPLDNRAVGFTSDGRIRVSRFHGFATGCESPGCTLAPLGWSATTIEPSTGDSTFEAAEVPFLVPAIDHNTTRMAADASWVYAPVEQGGARYLDLETGSISTGPMLGRFVGWSLDGSFLYGSRFADAGTRLIVSSFDASGDRSRLSSITLPAGGTDEPELSTPALFVVSPPS